jgi:hypothetical protein
MPASSSAVLKRVLLVERAGGPLLGLNDYFDVQGVEVLRAPDARALSTLTRDMRRLSAIVINAEALRGDVLSLVPPIKEQHPDLPIFWFVENVTPSKLPRKVDLVGPDVKKLQAALAFALRESVYTGLFVSRFTALCASTLEQYRLPATPETPYIKASTSSMNEVSAYITLTGRHVSGHVLLSSTSSDVRQAYCKQFPRERTPGIDDLEDHLGEAVNRIVGRLKRMVDRDEDCVVGVPYFIRGDGVCLRHKTGAPALAIELSNGNERLQLELCLYRFDDWAMASFKGYVPHDDELEMGEIKLL